MSFYLSMHKAVLYILHFLHSTFSRAILDGDPEANQICDHL